VFSKKELLKEQSWCVKDNSLLITVKIPTCAVRIQSFVSGFPATGGIQVSVLKNCAPDT